jgi:hypothetical protein
MCENSVRNVTALFAIFHGSVDEGVVSWDITAIHGTILCSAESRL